MLQGNESTTWLKSFCHTGPNLGHYSWGSQQQLSDWLSQIMRQPNGAEDRATSLKNRRKCRYKAFAHPYSLDVFIWGKKKMSVGMTLWAPTGRSKWQAFFLSLLYAKRLQEKHYGQPKGFYYSLKSAEALHPEASTHSPVILSQKRIWLSAIDYGAGKKSWQAKKMEGMKGSFLKSTWDCLRLFQDIKL